MLFPTTLVGSYPQPEWLIDRGKLAGRFPPRVRARELWLIPEPYLAAAQDDGDMTVVLPAEAVALLDAIRAAITALPDTAEVRDAVADLGEGGAAQVRADA